MTFFMTIFFYITLSFSYQAELVTSGHKVIWGMAFLDENNILFTERSGAVKVLDLKTKEVGEVSNPPPSSEHGQGGLLDVVLDPNFQENKIVYFTYAAKVTGGYTTRLSKATLKDVKERSSKEKNRKELINHQVLFSAEPVNGSGVHFGSRIAFDDKGYLFFTVGDRGDRHGAQDLNQHLGKVLRINRDGSIPKDNPFYNQDNTKKEIWSYGHRNAQGLFFDTKSKQLWEQEHGPRGGDEINLIEKGKNYGWPVITYGREYYGPKIGTTKKEGMEQPIYHFTPSIAPSGFIKYSGKVYKEWEDNFFSGALVRTHLNRLYREENEWKEERLFESMRKRVRDVRESPAGLIYFSTDSGEIYRISSKKAK